MIDSRNISVLVLGIRYLSANLFVDRHSAAEGVVMYSDMFICCGEFRLYGFLYFSFLSLIHRMPVSRKWIGLNCGT